MGKYICAIENGWDLTLTADWYFNFWWQVQVKSVQDMVSKVLAAAGSDTVGTLVILGHGRPGFQAVGCGKNLDPTSEKSLYASSVTGLLEGNAEHFMSLLKPKLEPGAVVSLGGCRTGAGTDGERLLKRLTAILGVKVEAGTDNQSPLPGFEGPVRRCDLNGCSILPANPFY